MNPYQEFAERAFWKLAVDGKRAAEIDDLWRPKFHIDEHTSIVTAGSCFAQHISKALRSAKYNWLDLEPCAFLPAGDREAFGYGVFSFRTGNIYTAAMLLQWLKWALEKTEPPDELWQRDGRFIDPFRPAIEPDGFESGHELIELRKQTLAAVRKAVEDAELWVFTLGLTEAWQNIRHGYWYSMCPGTVAGEFDPRQHRFHNFTHAEVTRDLQEIVALIRAIRPGAKFLFTVSPVPLTATASGQHVMVATEYSKSVLRAAAGEVVLSDDGADYFSSYEIITSHPYRGAFFNDNMRTVTPDGVAFVMGNFFSALGPAKPVAADESKSLEYADDPQCEDALLAAFRPT